MALIGIFTWNGPLPSDDEVGSDPAKRASADFIEQRSYQAAEPVAGAILEAVAKSGQATVGEPPFYADRSWHSAIRIDQRDYAIIVRWLDKRDGRHVFSVQPFAARGCFTAMFFPRPADLAQPARDVLDSALTHHPTFTDFRWIDEKNLNNPPATSGKPRDPTST